MNVYKLVLHRKQVCILCKNQNRELVFVFLQLFSQNIPPCGYNYCTSARLLVDHSCKFSHRKQADIRASTGSGAEQKRQGSQTCHLAEKYRWRCGENILCRGSDAESHHRVRYMIHQVFHGFVSVAVLLHKNHLLRASIILILCGHIVLQSFHAPVPWHRPRYQAGLHLISRLLDKQVSFILFDRSVLEVHRVDAQWQGQFMQLWRTLSVVQIGVKGGSCCLLPRCCLKIKLPFTDCVCKTSFSIGLGHALREPRLHSRP